MAKEILRIGGGESLFGKVTVHGAKNAVLPMLAASVLTQSPVTVRDCPLISDVDDMILVLRALGVSAVRDGRNVTVSGAPSLTEIPAHLACAM